MFSEFRSLDVVDGEVPITHECDQIIRVAITFDDLPDPSCGLIVSGARRVDVDGVKDLKSPGLFHGIISLLVNEYEQRVSSPDIFCRADLNGEDDCGCFMLVTFRSTLRLGKSIPLAELPSS